MLLCSTIQRANLLIRPRLTVSSHGALHRTLNERGFRFFSLMNDLRLFAIALCTNRAYVDDDHKKRNNNKEAPDGVRVNRCSAKPFWIESNLIEHVLCIANPVDPTTRGRWRRWYNVRATWQPLRARFESDENGSRDQPPRPRSTTSPTITPTFNVRCVPFFEIHRSEVTRILYSDFVIEMD